MSIRLSDLEKRIKVLSSHGPADTAVGGLCYDSRKVHKGDLFFALPGVHTDGKIYIDAAIKAGAAAVIHEGSLDSYEPGVAYRQVESARFAMSPVSDEFYGRPSRSLKVFGVTGTEGKSTTVYLIYQLLKLSGRKAGFFSTVNSDTGKGEEPNPEHQTTPEATAVMRMLATMRDSGLEYAVVESSSHGLSPRTNRLGDVAFDVSVFMNVTHEHLEFHGTWEQYRDDKANLFRDLDRYDHSKGGIQLPSFGVACADDPSAPYFAAAARKPTYTFSSKGKPCDFEGAGIQSDASGVSFTIVEHRAMKPASDPAGLTSAGRDGAAGGRSAAARIELPGAFNVDNTLAALMAVSGLTGEDWESFLPLLPKLRPVKGRMTTLKAGQPFEVIVDYAHTPSSFKTVFPPIRKRARGKMICVFGSAGERDTEKRHEQGRIAADYFDIVILTDEDPRGEVPMDILKEIASGCPERVDGKDMYLIPDRPTAIKKAFTLAQKDDIVMLLGKGHENSIIYKDGPHPYDEISCALSALASLGYKEKA